MNNEHSVYASEREFIRMKILIHIKFFRIFFLMENKLLDHIIDLN